MFYRLVLIFMILLSSDVFAAGKHMRKSSSRGSGKKQNARSSGTRSVKSSGTTTSTASVKSTENTTTSEDPYSYINDGNCDSYYTRCMNKICSSDTMGKCVCYEDKFVNNLEPKFITIDGMKIKQGFETLEYAKKQCTYILDKCMEQRRGITEKYKNFVQRDCLMISKEDAVKEKGLMADLKELKECVREACTLVSLDGYENFNYPEYSLCFNEDYAKFSMDAYCTKVIAKSSAPLAVRQLFLDEMALAREKSCISMHGTMSGDRKTCNVRISYGVNKEKIKASKMVPVGGYFQCSADEFNTKKMETNAQKQARINNILSLTASGLNMAGATLTAIGGVTDPIGKFVDMGLDIAENVTDLGMQVAAYKRGEIDKSQMTSTAIGSTISIGLSALSWAKGVKAAGTAAKTAQTVATVAQTVNKTATALRVTKQAIDVASKAADIAISSKADKEQMKEESLDIIKHAEVDRASGVGYIEDTLSERGNCFLNGEWFATENENLLLLWRN